MCRKPVWSIPPNFADLVADSGTWEDDRWAPIRLMAISDTTYNSREIPLAWQIEFEPDDDIFRGANEKLKAHGFDVDGYGWGQYLYNKAADITPSICESLQFGDCETSTCVIWTESEAAAQILVEMIWELIQAGLSKSRLKGTTTGPNSPANQKTSMQISISAVSYRQLGSHRALSGAWLAPFENPSLSFGTAIEEIAAYAWVRPRNGPLPEFESLYDRFETNFPLVPKIWFRRKKRLVEIAYATRLGAEEDLLGDPCLRLTPSLFREGCEELTTILKLLRKSIKPSDDFDIDAFLAFSDQQLETIPTDNESLELLFKRYQEFSKQWLIP